MAVVNCLSHFSLLPIQKKGAMYCYVILQSSMYFIITGQCQTGAVERPAQSARRLSTLRRKSSVRVEASTNPASCAVSQSTSIINTNLFFPAVGLVFFIFLVQSFTYGSKTRQQLISAYSRGGRKESLYNFSTDKREHMPASAPKFFILNKQSKRAT